MGTWTREPNEREMSKLSDSPLSKPRAVRPPPQACNSVKQTILSLRTGQVLGDTERIGSRHDWLLAPAARLLQPIEGPLKVRRPG